MSLKYGLIVKSKAAPAPVRRAVLDEDDEDDDNDNDVVDTPMPNRPKAGGPTKKPPPRLRKEDDDGKQDLSSLAASHARVKAAEEIDSSIFDYDSFHDAKSTVSEAKKAADRQDAVERRPKYINNLLDAAARRKQDQLIAREKLLQKEREAEGDEFADKDKFVTGAYKQHQEEARRLEEEEKKKAEEDEKRKRAVGGGMQGFYKSMMDQTERQHQEAIDAAAKIEAEGTAHRAGADQAKSDADLAAELKAKGVNVHINEEGQVTDKRELLSAGLNVAASGKGGDKHGADHLRTSNRPTQAAFQKNGSSQQAQRERQSRMMEGQLAEKTKRVREEEEEERARLEKAAKSLKTDKDVGDAIARYLARKAAKERGE
ncbi:hypothetical protein LTR08_006586 [Meristemomyces frigidus]|nr:hypothetical protein LTR08_006586 [Meristemomyces frigidus]